MQYQLNSTEKGVQVKTSNPPLQAHAGSNTVQEVWHPFKKREGGGEESSYFMSIALAD